MVEAKEYTLDTAGEPAVVELNEQIFGARVNPDLLYRTVRMQLMNRRQGTSSTKTRGEVRGGGRKPWRQKGTGRARAGSRRSPLWVGGGTVFGPKPRSYNVKLTKKMRKRALSSALSDRARDGQIVLIDRIRFDVPKTKEAISLLGRLGMGATTLVVVGSGEYNREVRKSFSNLHGVKCLACAGINVYDVLRHEGLVLTRMALDELKERC
ncbi:50S ribosomal protein L4 [Candidatus Bipolaricaulota bacterium]|nr:50S ribosomal protein L4 [Candidatus Bipolaricaulota bacterium]